MLEEGAEYPKLNPFLKWAGSKRRLLSQLKPFIPDRFGKYFEPFLGGGSMFFALLPKNAQISDASPSLIETYKALKRDVEGVIRFLQPLELSKSTFEEIKHKRYHSSVSRAGAFIYLNKACWNGLYRVNSSGVFNVPYGFPKSGFIFDSSHLRECSKALRSRQVSVKKQDFSAIDSCVKSGDFVFLDPPYVTAHNTNGFVDWNERLFGWKDQVILSELARELSDRGANVLVTNADHPSVRELYADFGFHRIERHSTLASDSSKRGRTTEALFFAGPHYEDFNLARASGLTRNDGQRRANRSKENSAKRG